MIDVSPEFQQAVYAPARRTLARVTFDISDVSAADDATATVTDEAEISRKDQLHNQKRDRPAYATFETDYWRLDGSFVVPPKVNELGPEVGWYSDTMSGPDGTFAPSQVMEFDFTADHSSMGLTITFDTPADEYAADFDIDVYDSSNNVIHSEQVRGNDQARYVLEHELEDYRRVVVTLLKWCKPDRRAKVIEVSFGVVRDYEDDKLIKVNLVEELSPLPDTVPANELKFTVDNSSKEFNILNPAGAYRYLMERQAATVELAVETTPGIFEWVGMGMYFLADWQSDEGALTTTFTARNRIDFIPDIEIENLTGSGTNLNALAVSVLAAAGITNYDLDPALSSVTTQGVYKKASYRKLLQMIALAGQCVMYVDREDRLHIIRLTSSAAVDHIDFDNVYKEPQIKLDKLVSRVEVNYYSDVDTVAGTHVLASPTTGGATLRIENTLINTLAHAQAVATWVMAESNNRALYDVNWRQNPALETGDIVTIEDSFGANKTSRITQQEYEYAGYLSGKTKSKGAI